MAEETVAVDTLQEPAADPVVEPIKEQPTAPPADSDVPPPKVDPAPTSEPVSYKLPEGIPPEIGEFAKSQKFTQAQLDATLQQFGGIMQASEQKRGEALRQLGEAHLKNWGDQAKHRLGLAKRALAQNDPEGKLAKALNESGYGNHPAVLDFLYNLGKGMREGGFLKSAVHRPPGEKSAAQAMYGDKHPSKEN